MSIGQRQFFLASLVGIFLVQTWLVYADDAGRAEPPLSEHARIGQDLWHSHNCQSCHQLFGFGGFLGPDLTNVAGRLAPESDSEAQPDEDRTHGTAYEQDGPSPAGGRLERLAARLDVTLTTGSDRMPDFHLDGDERAAMAAFFLEMDRMGVGQIQRGEQRPPRGLFSSLMRTALPPLEGWSAEQRKGMVIAEDKGCIDCHLPNTQSSFRATDLTRIHSDVSEERVGLVLREGLPGKGMPAFALGEDEIFAVRAFLELLSEYGNGLRAAFESNGVAGDFSIFELPWFEYSK